MITCFFRYLLPSFYCVAHRDKGDVLKYLNNSIVQMTTCFFHYLRSSFYWGLCLCDMLLHLFLHTPSASRPPLLLEGT